MEKKNPRKYFGLTHGVPMDDLPKWKEEKCSKNIHAFDEVFSGDSHHLVCDACQLIVEIAEINTDYVE